MSYSAYQNDNIRECVWNSILTNAGAIFYSLNQKKSHGEKCNEHFRILDMIRIRDDIKP